MCVCELVPIELLTGFGQFAPGHFAPGQFALANILSPDNLPHVNLPWDMHSGVQIIVYNCFQDISQLKE
jgi:hypothetical protein